MTSPPAGAAEAADEQERLRLWAEKEILELRMQQTERSAVRCGDAVYTLAWEPSKGRALLMSYDPGFYFPEWPEDGEMDAAEYPRRVHFAWELPEDQEKGLKARVRRITYELGPIGAATKPGATQDGIPRHEWIYGTDGDPVLIVGDKVNADPGTISRTYPWAPGKPSGITCYLTDAEWLLDDLKGGHTIYTLPEDKAAFRVRSDGEVLEHLDLMLDFIPVVHITNSIPEPGEHWGRSALAPVLQALDELSATDTDAAAAAATTGAPVVSVSGARIGVDRTTGQPKPLALAPGSVFQLADGGRMDVLNTAPQLAEPRSRTDHLIDRVAVNSRITSGVGHPRPDRPAIRVCPAARPRPPRLPRRLHAPRPRPYVRAAPAHGRTPPPGRPGVARRGNPQGADHVRPPHTHRPGRDPRRSSQGVRGRNHVPGDRGADAHGRRIPRRGRTGGDRPYPVPCVRGRGSPRRCDWR
ncbi:hypothetical protein [Streptomyces sp. NPDC058092]|uniref:hypothetical protein n=1 Tax=Streptomyces sp. NPDC058092 TaxID=3346336 RepID=UPI0036F0E32F